MIYIDLYTLATQSNPETRFMMVHDTKNEDAIKSFFQEVYELFIKVCWLSNDNIILSIIYFKYISTIHICVRMRI